MICWVDAGAGASGDMLLGALLALDPAGLPEAQRAVDAVTQRLGAPAVLLSGEPTLRGGMAATRAVVQCPHPDRRRTWGDIAPVVSGRAHDAFAMLAAAEAVVHGVPVEEVHFHEVGALDAIADIVAVCALWDRLAPAHVVVSPVCVGSGTATTEHGSLPVPVPAVTELLRGVPTFGGPVAHEACTPTGAALLRVLADEWGPQPGMTVQQVGVGAGGRDTEQGPNVLRVLTGDAAEPTAAVVQVEATIDDLDPRVYPEAIEALKDAGALEAWLVPVVMKHGRPGVTLTALVPEPSLAPVTEAVFAHTTTLGVRWFPVERRTLDRDVVEADVEGHRIRVKRGWWDGRVITRQPEYQDAAAAARALGRPVREILAEAGEEKGSDATDGGDSGVRTP